MYDNSTNAGETSDLVLTNKIRISLRIPLSESCAFASIIY